MVDAIRNSQIPGLPPLYSIYVYQAHDSATPKRDIAALFTALSAAAQPGDTFILYFSGHGAAGELVLDSNVDITTKLSLWQNAQRAILGDPKFLEQYLGVEDFKFGALSACHVYVIVEACFSGTITIDGTVVRYEGITGSEHAGRDYAVLTSTAKDELSAGYNTGQVILGLGAIVGGSDFTEEGGAFTSHLLHALTHYGGNTTYQALNGAFEDAKAAMNTQVYIASRPQKISGVNPGICPCLTRLAPASNTIQVGGRVTLTGLDPYDRTIPTSNLTWTASNSSATVVSGVVTGVSPGTVTVTATQTNTSPPITATALITVQAAPALPLEVTSFSPYQGSLPGSQLTINGTSLGGAAATVLFTDASGQNTLAGVVAPDSADSQLRVTVPSAARTGYFQVSNAGASSYSRNFGLPAPLIVGGPVSIAFGVVSNAGDTAVVVGPNANCFDVTSGASLDIEPTVPIVTSTIPGFSIRFITNFGSVALAGTYNPTDGSYTASTAGSVGSRYTVTGRINSDGSGSGTLSESKTYSIWTCTGTTTFTTSSRP
jgi:hypothetical protein